MIGMHFIFIFNTSLCRGCVSGCKDVLGYGYLAYNQRIEFRFDWLCHWLWFSLGAIGANWDEYGTIEAIKGE